MLTVCAKYISEDVHQNGCFKCEILLLISQSVYLFLPVTFRLLSAIFFIRLPLNGDTVVILCRRIYLRVDIGLHLDSCCLSFFLFHIASLMPLVLQSTNLAIVSPSIGSRLKKIADSSRNVSGRKKVN